MPLPIILGAAALISGLGGVGAGVHGAMKMKDANDTMESAKSIADRSNRKFKEHTKSTEEVMETLGKFEVDILKSFENFSEIMEKIQNKPEFKEYSKSDVKLPKYNPQEIKDISVGAGVLLGGLGGATMGTAAGFAAGGVTTAAVMALGTASTGTAIASLSGAAATNATLAALGGGAIAAGGGGMALGTAILGASTLGVGLLIGGAIFKFTGENLSKKADEAWYQAHETEKTVDKICEYLVDLKETAISFNNKLTQVNNRYREILSFFDYKINRLKETDWNFFSVDEKKSLENLVYLVGLLYKMCKVNLVIRSEDKDGINSVNHDGVIEVIKDANVILKD